MTYEQLEYVARAIFCADARGGLREWLAIDQDHRNYYMRLAKAAAAAPVAAPDIEEQDHDH